MSRHKNKRKRKNLSDSSDDNNNEIYKFDRTETVRLISELLLKNREFKIELLQLYKRLDEKEVIILEGLEDKNLKKKLRHIFKAMRLEKKIVDNKEGYFKSKICKHNIYKIFKQILKEAENSLVIFPKEEEKTSTKNSTDITDRSIIILNSKTKNTENSNSENENIDLDDFKRKRDNWMIELPSSLDGLFSSQKAVKHEKETKDQTDNNFEYLKEYIDSYNKQFRSQSLLDMHQQGQFKNFNKEQQEYINSHQYGSSDPYKKSKKGAAKDGGTPWRTFDRDTDLNIKRTIQAEDFHRLLDNSKKLDQRFGQPRFQSSFL